MKSQLIAGGGGTKLNVVETGNPQGQSVLFLHGFSQCWMSWSRQMNSDLALQHRLVAMDLRGHGLSDKPRDGYEDSRLWAEDVNAVIESLSLERPILSGWSYGPLVILDYVRHYGEDAIGGIHFVNGITKLGNDAALAALTPEFLSLVPGLLSEEAAESSPALESLLRLCFVQEPPPADLELMLGYNVSVPPYVRQALFSRSFDNDDLMPTIRKPVLITHGTGERVVKPTVVDQHQRLMPHAEVQMIAGGHASFWENASDFNERLRAFAAKVRREGPSVEQAV